MVHENFAYFARCQHFDKFCPPSISSLVPSLEKGKRNRMKERKLVDEWRKKEIKGKRKEIRKKRARIGIEGERVSAKEKTNTESIKRKGRGKRRKE